MNATKIVAAAAFATLAAMGAQAGEAYQPASIPDYAQNSPAFQSTLTRAEVRAETAQAVRAGLVSHGENYPAAVVAKTEAAPSGLARATVRAQAIAALRAGQIPHGDAYPM